MERTLEVRWIRHTGREDTSRAISWLGGVDNQGRQWAMTPEDLIGEMWAGGIVFVRTPEGDCDVIVVREGLRECLVLEDGRDLAQIFPGRNQ